MVKKKRTLKRHSTYKRNKNKKKSFKQLKIKMYKGKKYNRKSIKKKLRKQKGGNLQIMQPLVQALGIVGLVGGLLYNKRWKDDENSNSTPREYTEEDKMSFIKRYMKNFNSDQNETNFQETIKAGGVGIDQHIFYTWVNIISTVNGFIQIIEISQHKAVSEYLKNIEKYIISFDLADGEKNNTMNEVKNLSQLGTFGSRYNRQPVGFVKKYIPFIIMSIFLIYLNERDNINNIEYSEIFNINDLNNAISSIIPSSGDGYTVKELDLVEIFKDSTEIIKGMGNIVKTPKDDNEVNVTKILDEFLETKYHGTDYKDSGIKGSDLVPKKLRATNFYEVLIKRNMNDNKT